MKRILLTIVTATMFAACSNNADDTAKADQLQASDTTGLSEFQSWKKEQDMVVNMPAMNTLPADANTISSPVAAQPVSKPATRIIYRDRPVKKSAPKYEAPVYTEPEVVSTPVSAPVSTGGRDAVYRTSAGGGEGNSTGTSEGTDAGISKPVVTAESQPAKKEGWSKAAKGAVIGGATGAVLGAIVSKNKGMGAVIGAAVGAGGGYVIGRGKDKKDGRY